MSWRLPGISSTVAPCARICTVLAGLVEAGAMMVAAIPPAAAYADTAAPPLPELSSRTWLIPWARSNDSITLAPRSLKLLVGLNHSHFSSACDAGDGAGNQRACCPRPV